ncbi:probable trehalose-phosphate phosphatase J [Tanacetum coccineum]
MDFILDECKNSSNTEQTGPSQTVETQSVADANRGQQVVILREKKNSSIGKVVPVLNAVINLFTGYANSTDVFPIYIVDDRTDEDAFKELTHTLSMWELFPSWWISSTPPTVGGMINKAVFNTISNSHGSKLWSIFSGKCKIEVSRRGCQSGGSRVWWIGIGKANRTNGGCGGIVSGSES